MGNLQPGYDKGVDRSCRGRTRRTLDISVLFFIRLFPVVVLSHVAVLYIDIVAFAFVGKRPRVVDQATVVRGSKSAALTPSPRNPKSEHGTNLYPGREYRA